MDLEAARSRLDAERAQLRQRLAEAGRQERDRRAENGPGDAADTAQPLVSQYVDVAVAGRLRDRLEAVERALGRVEDGTYGRSVRSGAPIPDARLDADPAAELTVEEAAADQGPGR